MLFSEFDIVFVTIKAIKGQAIAEYLEDQPLNDPELSESLFPIEDVMLYFDGATNSSENGVGAILVSPKGQQIPILVKLNFDCTNNVKEYDACIVDLQVALEFGANDLSVFGDSLLIISQIKGEWQAQDTKLILYQKCVNRLIPKFRDITFAYFPQAHNQFADALATLASMVKLSEGDDMQKLRIEVRGVPTYCMNIEECMSVEVEADEKPWYHDIKAYIKNSEYPFNATDNEKKFVWRMACQFFLSGEVLYKRNHNSTLLRCIDASETNNLMEEMHEGLLEAHASGPLLARKIMRAGYYWLTMESDCIKHWVEAASYRSVTQAVVARFLKHNIICYYGVPEELITDNGANLNGKMIQQLWQQFKIEHINLVPYRPQMNGAVEATNKNIKKILHGGRPSIKVERLSLKILSQEKLSKAECPGSQYEQLNMIDEKRMTVICHGQLYQRRVERAFNKKVRPRVFVEGDLVLKKHNQAMPDHRGKFSPTYDGQYVVKKAFSGGALILANMDGRRTSSLSIMELEVGQYLSVPNKASKVPTFAVATLKALSLSASLV
ncbi:uncharacterized protein LOC142605914 [Castanea sativa]|uniref:uncharacterized protein LOC142605914 n=1 Tax=Castanea sativa TaxID=21020 RepID=UPI003F64CF31